MPGDGILHPDEIDITGFVCNGTDGEDAASGFDESAFLRSDASDTFTGSTLVVAPDSTLQVDGNLVIGGASGVDDDSIYFDDEQSEWIRWNNQQLCIVGGGCTDAGGEFEVSDDLSVEGDLLVDGKLSFPAKTRYYSISPAEFTSWRTERAVSKSALEFHSLDLGFCSSNGRDCFGAAVEAYAGVHLPHGAVITSMKAVVRDASSFSDISVRLMRTPLLGDAEVLTYADTFGDGTPGIVVLEDSPAAGGSIVNNRDYSYAVHASWENGPSCATCLQMRSVVIEYQVTQPLP